MRRTRTRRIVIAGATAGAVLLTGGVAFAFWSSTGTAAGAAEVALNATELDVEQALPAVTNIFPGGPARDVTVTVTNTGGTDIDLSDVEVTVDDAIEVLPGICAPGDFVVVDNPLYSGEVLEANGDTTTFVAATIQLTDTAANQDPCKGASLVLSLVAS